MSSEEGKLLLPVGFFFIRPNYISNVEELPHKGVLTKAHTQ